MTSAKHTSNQMSSIQSVFKDNKNYYPQKINSIISCTGPSSLDQPSRSNFFVASDFSKKNFPIRERFNSFNSFNNEKEDDLSRKPFLYRYNSNLFQSFLDFHFLNNSREQSQFQLKPSNIKLENKKYLKVEPNNLLLNLVGNENENEQEKEEPKSGILFGNFGKKINFTRNHILSNDNIIIKGHNNFNFNDTCENEKNTNLNLNKLKDGSMGTKFFTNHNYGYKCSCSKTQCNRKYCECYNSGNYCIDCNCKNCKNQPPLNTYSNKRPSELVSKMKKSKEICTCTKSGCNKNYCECFKSGNKCSSLCRCIDCENTEDNIKLKNKNNSNYECCKANSIYIIKNKLVIENINNLNTDEENILYSLEKFGNKKDKAINKKRKREESKNKEEFKKYKNKKIKDEEQEQDQFLFNKSLFDKNGKVILRHINMIHY